MTHLHLFILLWFTYSHLGQGAGKGYSGSLYLSVTPKFYTKVLHQTIGLKPN